MRTGGVDGGLKRSGARMQMWHCQGKTGCLCQELFAPSQNMTPPWCWTAHALCPATYWPARSPRIIENELDYDGTMVYLQGALVAPFQKASLFEIQNIILIPTFGPLRGHKCLCGPFVSPPKCTLELSKVCSRNVNICWWIGTWNTWLHSLRLNTTLKRQSKISYESPRIPDVCVESVAFV